MKVYEAKDKIEYCTAAGDESMSCRKLSCCTLKVAFNKEMHSEAAE